MFKLYNTLTRKKEIFKPKNGTVELFVCGPTVYDFSHLGHARTYIFFDGAAKYLKYSGYKVFYLQNITDIDDRIIQRAKEKNKSPKELALYFEKEYMKDMRYLGINSVNKYARATDYIKEIQSQVKRLIDKGYGYEIPGDGIYYDISKFKDYGKLSRRTVEQAQDAVSRIDEAEKKKNKGDFCLWKFSKPQDPKWPSPWGEGRPGWHIEDTAITEKYFGPQYDLHGGARDLIFPHHEAEISQMEAISGKKPMVKYWLHPGFLTVEGQKMAKSLGNFITIRGFLKKYSARVLRLFVLKTHYRSPIDYSEKAILQAKRELERIDEFIEKLKAKNKKQKNTAKNLKLANFKKRFDEAMEDDFNTPKAMAVIFGLMKSGGNPKAILNFLREIDSFFQFIFWGKETGPKIPPLIQKMVKEREEARKNEDWAKADRIRKKIEKLGYKIEDAPTGPKIKKIQV